MRAENERTGQVRAWMSALGAVLVHGSVMLGLPDAAPIASQASAPDMVWLSATTMSADQLVVSDARVPSEPQVSATQAAPKPLISRAKQAKAHTQKHARTAPTVDLDSAAHDEAPASAATDLEGLMAPTAGDAQASADSDMAGLSEALRGALGTGASSGEGSGMRAAGGVVGRKPGLLAVRNPCSGFFPASAQADHGQVQVSVHVDAAGRVQVSHVLNESPNGQAFGEAARACAAALRFEPARDGLGAPIDGDAKLELRFSRS